MLRFGSRDSQDDGEGPRRGPLDLHRVQLLQQMAFKCQLSRRESAFGIAWPCVRLL